MNDPRVYLVPLVDVNWAKFAPLDPVRAHETMPAPLEQCAREVEACIDLMRDLVGGQAVYAVHSGVYNRDGFYRAPFLDLFRRAVADGGELCIHTHEETVGQGTRNRDEAHMLRVIEERLADLEAAGLAATSYRGGHYAYCDYLTPALERLGLGIDFSSAPGLDRPDWDATWAGAPTTAHYLAYDAHAAATGAASSVLEIPLGADGTGLGNRSFLFTEEADDDDLRRVWAAILGRAEREGPQCVHILFHSMSLGLPHFLDRFRRFMDHAAATGARFVSPAEAKRAVDALMAAA